MNRKYLVKDFKEKVELLRKNFLDVALTTDIIVGFPGETEEEFNKTYEFLKEIEFSKMHIFKYSPRKGTVAAKMDEQIDEEIKEIRSKKLIELSNNNEKKFMSRYLGKEVKVLFEQKENENIKGHTANYILVKSVYKNGMEGKIKNVKIKGQANLELLGEIM